MYNGQRPTQDELPSARTLLRSTAIALVAAGVILATIVLPAEYGIDPTGVGGLLGLTQMGEIKAQLAAEATADAEDAVPAGPTDPDTPTSAPASASASEPKPEPPPEPAAAESALPTRSDEFTIDLAPGQGTEIKLAMRKGDEAEFEWTAHGDLLNFDLHGSGEGQKISYEKGRGVPEADGVLTAAFDGFHGWFWRNRTDAPVKLTVRTSGAYTEFKRFL